MKRSVITILAIVFLTTLSLGTASAVICPSHWNHGPMHYVSCSNINQGTADNCAYYGAWTQCEPAPSGCFCVIDFVSAELVPIPGSSFFKWKVTYSWYHCCP